MENYKELIAPLIAILLGNSALFTFIQFIIQRHDNKKNVDKKFEDVSKEIKTINDKIDRNSAILARTHILRFADDLRNGIEHSDEYFRQQLEDIDTYNAYCKANKNFSNGLTVSASKFITDEYDRMLKREARKNETKQ